MRRLAQRYIEKDYEESGSMCRSAIEMIMSTILETDYTSFEFKYYMTDENNCSVYDMIDREVTELSTYSSVLYKINKDIDKVDKDIGMSLINELMNGIASSLVIEEAFDRLDNINKGNESIIKKRFVYNFFDAKTSQSTIDQDLFDAEMEKIEPYRSDAVYRLQKSLNKEFKRYVNHLISKGFKLSGIDRDNYFRIMK